MPRGHLAISTVGFCSERGGCCCLLNAWGAARYPVVCSQLLSGSQLLGRSKQKHDKFKASLGNLVKLGHKVKRRKRGCISAVEYPSRMREA